jgi:hypothetical protein
MTAVYIFIAIVILLAITAAILISVAMRHEWDTEERCEKCFWFYRRFDSEPCRACERGSKYGKSNFEEQEWD